MYLTAIAERAVQLPGNLSFLASSYSHRRLRSHSKKSEKQTETATLAILQRQGLQLRPTYAKESLTAYLDQLDLTWVSLFKICFHVYSCLCMRGKTIAQNTYLKKLSALQTCKTPGLRGEWRRAREWRILPESCVKHEQCFFVQLQVTNKIYFTQVLKHLVQPPAQSKVKLDDLLI